MYFLYCFVIIFSLCDLSYVNCKGPIHIQITFQNKTYVTYDKDLNLDYYDGDVVKLSCRISDFRKSQMTTWVDNYGKVYLTESTPTLDLSITLKDAQDGLKLYCKSGAKTDTLYVNFIRNKAETARKKPTIFWILILTICGFVGGSIILLIIWSLISRLCKKKEKKCDTQAIYSENLDNTHNNLTLEASTPQITIMDISNQRKDLQNGVMENDIEKREDIDSDRRENCRENSLYITVEESKRHGSSTEC